jgi:hypothetical protein
MQLLYTAKVVCSNCIEIFIFKGEFIMSENTVSDEEFGRIPNAEEASYLTKVQGGVQSLFLGAPILADVDRIVTSADWADGALTIAAQPDVPRNITITLTDANDSVTGVCTVVGTDIRGRTITEVQTISVAGTGKVFTGTKIFASVTSATISNTAGATAATDLVTVGVGKVIGTPMDLDSDATVRHAYLGGTKLTPTVTTGVSLSGIDASSGTYDGSKMLQVFLEVSRIY